MGHAPINSRKMETKMEDKYKTCISSSKNEDLPQTLLNRDREPMPM